MILYSQTLLSFARKLNSEVRNILSEEMGIKVRRTRFYWEGYLVPFQVVLFEQPGKLGYFDSNSYRIGVHKDFVLHTFLEDPESVKNLLRHELAHFIQYLTYGNSVQPHGTEYRNICRTYGWGKEVYSAKENMETHSFQRPERESSLVRKVKKLLKLADSSNPHEAEAATLKANEILMKYNLTCTEDDSEEREVALLKSLPFKRKNGKISAITRILETFYVEPILNYGSSSAYIEILGERVNVEIAGYVADFLNRELERLWEEQRKADQRLKGQNRKNAFMKGIAAGFIAKRAGVLNIPSSHEKALILNQRSLIQPAKNCFYRNLGSSSTPRGDCAYSRGIGEKKGRELTINPALKSGSWGKLITHVSKN